MTGGGIAFFIIILYLRSMTTFTSDKLKCLTSLFNERKILSSNQLAHYGFSQDLIQWYRKSGWLTSLGKGVYTFYNTNPLLDDCISFLQTEKKLNLFYAGKYSLSRFYNVNHFLTTEEIKPQLVLGTESKLPSWFSEKYGNQFSVMQTDFLKSDKGYETIELQNKLLVHSSEERAFLELLYETPEKTTVTEAYELLEMLPNLKPHVLQKLLENCSSVKVKRLFLYLAEKVNHAWFKYLDISKISIGKGVREIEKHGTFISKYNIVVKLENI